MTFWAQLNDNNQVLQVTVGDDNVENASAWLTDNIGGRWVQTMPDNYAGIGYTYDAVNDVFIAPQPYPSWTLDNDFNWQAPTAKPDGLWFWDEDSLSWLEQSL